MNSIVLASDIARVFPSPGGSVAALRRVNLVVAAGELLALTGPSGSGKTTLLHLVALLDRPTSGALTVLGRDTRTMGEADLCRIRKARIGMVFQRFHLLSGRTALENVAFRFRYSDDRIQDQRRRALEALALLELEYAAERRVHLLSAGEMQRVAIARAIVAKPELLIADEPTGSLDPDSASRVMRAFEDLNRRGVTILVATHNPALAERCGRQVRCERGGVSG